MIDHHTSSKEIGDATSPVGKLDWVDYAIIAMKKSDYMSKIIANYGSLAVDELLEMRSRREMVGNGSVVKKWFHFILPFQNHFTHYHAVGGRSNHCRQVPALDETW